jgi:hypothetical protein
MMSSRRCQKKKWNKEKKKKKTDLQLADSE